MQQWVRKKIDKKFKISFSGATTNVEANQLHVIFISNVSTLPLFYSLLSELIMKTHNPKIVILGPHPHPSTLYWGRG